MNDQHENSPQQEMGLDLTEVEARKAFLEFTETDVALLKSLHALLGEERNALFSELFYHHLQHFPQLQPLLADAEKVERLKRTQSVYFSQLTEGEYGSAYIENRLRIGIAHQRVGLPPKWYIGAYRKYLGDLMPIICNLLGGNMEKCCATFNALLKIIFFDMELALDTYFYAERLEAEQRVKDLAQYDALTGLPNRNLNYDRIDYAYTLAQRSDGVLATMLIDLDRFKLVNESLGPKQGDELLKQAAKRLRDSLRGSDTVGRVGDNEFVMILLNMTAATDAAMVAKKILEVVAAPFQIEEHQLHLTASIGIAIAPTDGKNAQDLLKNAAIALDQAKKDGRNQFYFYQAEMNQRTQRSMLLERGLHRALKNSEFELYYQPKVDLRSGKICGLEALLRWQHTEHEMVLPDDFIHLLEETGLIVPVGTLALRTACAQAKAWQNMGIEFCCVAVNLSAIQFHRQDLSGLVQQVLSETGLDAKYLELEITESAIMKDVDRAVQTLRELKSLGVKLSVDDFGTGHSSLNYLKLFATDVLKIDRSFICDIKTDSDDALIARTIIGLAHNMDMKVIAEGVETEAQLAFLLRNQCDEMQGYLYSRPLPVEACTALLKEGRLLSLAS